MRHCIEISYNCPITPGAFSVGSSLFLPAFAATFAALEPHFQHFGAKGLILSDGWSRQKPGNTHAEANALTNLRQKYEELSNSIRQLPPIEEVLKDVECFTTMEPCSIRTSGGPSCARELVKSKIKTVYLGVKEPPDFVQCEGVRILQEGGVNVVKVAGLEEECINAARRGRE
ncbi:uncharacterized protein L203_104056 [Cryptococcus depauperatus CBS 7841]|uniref:CMP/dCMP-type deaminase domain-containing protein n=1 Tax=Cryptococcus depauperatus CBS 7841 TaxID=1295531 RepID=A0AAJ8JUZ4_9TREE